MASIEDDKIVCLWLMRLEKKGYWTQKFIKASDKKLSKRV